MGFDEKMTVLADAIRGKTKQTKELTLDEMATSVESIETGINTSDATASANEILQGETAYVNGEKITGTIETFDGSYDCSDESTGGSDGGNIETCTVTINISDNVYTSPFYCIINVIENGVITSRLLSESSVISNAIKNSTMFIFYPEDGHVFVQINNLHTEEQYLSMYSLSGMTIKSWPLELSSDAIIEPA